MSLAVIGPLRPVRCDLAIDHSNLACRPRGQLRIVGDHQKRNAVFVEILENFHDIEARRAVEIAGGFVGEYQLGPGDRRAGDGDTLALPAG